MRYLLFHRIRDTTLPKSAKENLVRLGLIEEVDGYPLWSVHKTYHWRERFPAHKILNVRHEYGPVVGWYQLIVGAAPFQLNDLVKHACLDPSLEKRLSAAGDRMMSREGGIHAMGTQELVKYILTTANTWRTPIKDFELIVERPGQGKKFISFCWDGKVQRLDENHFVARETNFIPARELNVYYLQGDFLGAEIALPFRAAPVAAVIDRRYSFRGAFGAPSRPAGLRLLLPSALRAARLRNNCALPALPLIGR